MDTQLSMNKRSPKRRLTNALVHILLAVLAIIWVLPIAWIVLTSFRAEPGAYTKTFLPQGYTLNNYVKLLTDRTVLDFPKMFMNTLIIAVISCIVSTLIVVGVAFALSRLRFKLRKLYMNLAMILGLFPGFMTMVAQYFILKSMGLTEGSGIRIGLIVVYTASAGLGYQIAKGDDLVHGTMGGLHLRKGPVPGERRPVHGGHRTVEHAAEGVHLPVVHLLCGRSRPHLHPHRHPLPLHAEVLRRGHVGSGQGLRHLPHSLPRYHMRRVGERPGSQRSPLLAKERRLGAWPLLDF